jgi:DNA replication protein DnaC
MSVQHERLIELCNELRLGGIAAQYPALAQTAAEKRTSFTDFVEDLLVAGRESRRARAREMFARVAGFPAIKTLDQYDFTFATGAPRKQIMELASLAFIERAENLVSSDPRVSARLISRSRSAISPRRRATKPASSVRPIWC